MFLPCASLMSCFILVVSFSFYLIIWVVSFSTRLHHMWNHQSIESKFLCQILITFSLYELADHPCVARGRGVAAPLILGKILKILWKLKSKQSKYLNIWLYYKIKSKTLIKNNVNLPLFNSAWKNLIFYVIIKCLDI
jgi:hypothetical protein